MKTSVRFNNAIAALVKGYLNNTLAKGTCYACAVGNMVASGIGATVASDIDCDGELFFDWPKKFAKWDDVFCSDSDTGEQRIWEYRYKDDAKVQIDSTGYSWQELARVERAFEQSTKINVWDYHTHTPEKIDADQLAGLHAVVQVLCDIEGIGDPEPFKAMFNKDLAAI